MPVAAITGASRGLGLALATTLSELGWSLVLVGRVHAALHAATSDLTGPVRLVAGDVADASTRATVIEAARRFGGLDLLVNNASTLGSSPMPALAELSPRELETVLRVNLVAPHALTAAALPLLRTRRGAVLNITSDAAVEPYEGWGAYSASKAGLEQLSAVLAKEEPDLRVWWVDPGDLRTQMHQDAFPGEDISDRPLPETVVPGFVHLIERRLASGRYRAADLIPAGRGVRP